MKTVRAFDILLPDVVQPEKWAVVSCDQFTSQRDYWERLADFVGDAPSTLKLIFPEVYLEDGDSEERIQGINAAMQNYLQNGVFKNLEDSFVLVKRETGYGNSRLGLVAAVDLEDYSFVHPNSAPIRSTEGVVADRIPPRLKIRKDAPVELPHIMLLIDDSTRTVLEPLYQDRDSLKKLYDFKLNMNGGRVEGYRVDAARALKAFDEYERIMKELYGDDSEFLFAVGDGNHSLATAQAHWNIVKQTLSISERETHPARFALCEIENLHDDGICFEPIHRFVFNVDDADFVSFLTDRLSGGGSFDVFGSSIKYTLHASENSALAISQIQEAIDAYIKDNPEAAVDYIHGIEHLEQISEKHSGAAVVMPRIEKNDLFSYVAKHGTLCRKAFSMGEAEEKRYYIEAKRIK